MYRLPCSVEVLGHSSEDDDARPTSRRFDFPFECGHSICLPCLQALRASRRPVICPLCRQAPAQPAAPRLPPSTPPGTGRLVPPTGPGPTHHAFLSERSLERDQIIISGNEGPIDVNDAYDWFVSRAQDRMFQSAVSVDPTVATTAQVTYVFDFLSWCFGQCSTADRATLHIWKEQTLRHAEILPTVQTRADAFAVFVKVAAVLRRINRGPRFRPFNRGESPEVVDVDNDVDDNPSRRQRPREEADLDEGTSRFRRLE